jgi:hypothetical protein
VDNKESRIQQAGIKLVDFLFRKKWPELMVEIGHRTVAPIYAVPNGGKRNAITATIMKREGVRSGVPDLCLPIKKGKYGALYIEVKTTVGGMSQNQKNWFELLEKTGNKRVICRSPNEIADAVRAYMMESEGL